MSLIGRARQGVRGAVRNISNSVRDRREATRLAFVERLQRAEQDRLAIDAAFPQFQAKLEAALTSYRPRLTQVQVDAADWSTPYQVERLLVEELIVIRDILTPLMKSADFPLGTTDPVLRARLRKYWDQSWAVFEWKAFNALHLPGYFQFWNGRMGYESVTPVEDSWPAKTRSYIGDRTRYRYIYQPVLRVPE